MVGAIPSDADVVMVQAMDSVTIEALPGVIPASIEVDVSSLEGPESPPITVADLPVIAGLTYISDMDDLICSLILSRAAISEEEEQAEEDALLESDVEPEVIGRGETKKRKSRPVAEWFTKAPTPRRRFCIGAGRRSASLAPCPGTARLRRLWRTRSA